MDEKKGIFVFICEDRKTSKEIIRQHFDKEKVTYVEIFDAEKRDEIVEKLAEVGTDGG